MALLYYILCKPRGFMTIEFQKKKKKVDKDGYNQGRIQGFKWEVGHDLDFEE